MSEEKPKRAKAGSKGPACPHCGSAATLIEREPDKATCKRCNIEFDVASKEAE